MRTKNVNTPSGLKYEIREATGADDQILTAMDGSDNEVIDKWIQRLIIKGPEDKVLSLSDVRDLRIRDKYVLLLKMRIFSLSERLIFPFRWSEGTEQEYDIDLGDFIWDYSKPIPEPGDEFYAKERILPYEHTPEELKLELGDLTVMFDHLNGHGEKLLLDLLPIDRSLNSTLAARNLRVVKGDTEQVVKNFAVFSSRDMMQIRNFIEKCDPEVSGNIEISNSRTLAVQTVSILEFKEFFYPAKI